MESKSDKVRRLLLAGELKEALRIAKDFKRGIRKEDSDAMKRGYESMAYPEFYQSLGMDVSLIQLQALQVLSKLYGTNYPQKN